jgi:Domain of unknown function DUF11
MPVIKDQQNIDDVRKRLYDRGTQADVSPRHSLTKITTDVSRGWGDIKTPVVAPVPVVVPEVANTTVDNIPPVEIKSMKKPRSYRMIIILASIGLFILVTLASSMYLFLGANQISVKNVSLTVSAPFAVAAGEKVPLQISVSNQNSIQIESVTLILNYPPGTKTADEAAKDLYEERIPVEVIAAGEAINVPANILLFGEENEEKEIKATVEYRVSGSNGVFIKEAEPIKVKINSSPLVVRVESVDKVSSGQEIEFKITLKSNAAAIQRNILVSAALPSSFTFIKSDPEPSYGQNEWLFDQITPGSSVTITLRGRVSGMQNETSDVQFAVGSPRSDNQFIMGSVLAKTKASYTIERPFIEVIVDINQDTDGEAIIDRGVDSDVIVTVKNTLDETIYDMRVEVAPKGNLIRDSQVNVSSGFYESSSKTIRYEVSGMASLAEVNPGESRSFAFMIKADPKQTTGSFDISTNVYARRVSQANATEQIVGTAVAQAKYSSEIKLDAQVGYNDGKFTDTGSVPPIAEKETTYTITFAAETGVNDASNMVMTTTLPQYVSWLNKFDGEGKVEFNPVSKQLRWEIGSMSAGTQKQLQIQVSLLPSVKQVGKSLLIVGNQELRAKDRFTNVDLKAQNSSLNNELSEEAGFAEGNGKVQSAQ